MANLTFDVVFIDIDEHEFFIFAAVGPPNLELDGSGVAVGKLPFPDGAAAVDHIRVPVQHVPETCRDR